MMTQDRGVHGVTGPFSPKNLNPSAPAFHQSPTGERSPADGMYSRTETGQQGIFTNGDISSNGTNYLLHMGGAGMLREANPQSQLAHQIQTMQNSMPMGLTLAPHPSNHQPGVSAVTSQQAAYAMAVQESGRVQNHVRASNPISAYKGNGESYENPSTVAHGTDEEISKNTSRAVELEAPDGGQDYPEEILEPIRKQMQFYFSSENLPNDKFLNQHMDVDKFIPLELFLDFGRIKPICNSIDQLTKAVETSSILELSEDRKKARVSQCRKTLTLRGFPISSTEEDVRQFILEIGNFAPTHIEFVMFKDNYSVWYVSFKDETAARDTFFQLHNQEARVQGYKGNAIGCCIKSSGTPAAAGYFQSSEESNQRRMAYQNQVAAAAAIPAPVHAVQNPMPQPHPQQPPALIQPFSAMQLHSYLPGSPANIYYQQTPQGSYMPYMAGMIHSWPAPAAPMEPGLIMQNNGLQPQHIRTSMPRPHLMPAGGNTQHRFNRPQRSRQSHVDSNSDRPVDRPSLISGPPRSSPQIDSNTAGTVISQGGFMPRRPTVQEDLAQPVIPQMVSHQYVPPMITQQQQHHQHHAATTAALSTAVNTPGLESMAVPHYQPLLPHHHQQHQHSMLIQTDTASAPPPPPPQISNPPPNAQQMHHHHHHNQPPPPVPQLQQHHQQQQTQNAHQHTQHQSNHIQNHHFNQPMPLPLQPHHHHQPAANHHQQHHPQHMVPPYHHHHPQQQHHQYMPPKVHHQQFPPTNRGDKRARRKKEDVKNHRGNERSQSNRGNFGSQALAAADNFTMEANSFPPLPGAQNNITNSEVSHESRMSDIVRGISRNPSLGGSSILRASSTTPSPVATPAPPSAQQQGLSGSAVGDDNIIDNGDLVLDDDVTSSSQEDVDTDINIYESRHGRSEQSSAVESLVFSSQRSQKVSPPVALPATVLSPRQTENRQVPVATQADFKGPQPSVQYHQQASPTAVSTAVLSSEAPRLSYAQILAQKNREASNNAGNGENLLSGGQVPNPNSGTFNDVNLTQEGVNLPVGGGRTFSQSSNAFREHGNYQSGQQHGPRSSQRGSSKDGVPRSEGPPPSSRQPSGSRRNSKENRTSNKYDRRKPDTRPK